MNPVEKKLGYSFNDSQWLNRALSHRSYAKENNERLEFLGDSLLNFIVAEYLYHQFPEALEGELSRMRSYVVKGETLTTIAKELQLGSYLLLGSGELRAGGEHRASILADGVEALIAAVYLDADLEQCRKAVLRWFEKELLKVSPDKLRKDAKSQLQEYLQSHGLALPEYSLVNVAGKEHEQQFTVECKVENLKEAVSGVNASRRKAEQTAAENVLNRLGIPYE